MVSKHNIRLNPNRNKAVHTGIAFASGDKGITLVIEVEEMDCSNTTAKIVFKRSNGTSVEADITGSNNVYTYELRGNELEIPGLVVADVKFYEGTKRISTATFTFTATSDTMDGLGAGAGGYSDRLEQLVEEAESAVDEAERIYNDATNTANAAKDTLNNTTAEAAQTEAELKEMLVQYQNKFGEVGVLNPRGTYNSATTYEKFDLVYYGGVSWLCLQSCTGVIPVEGAYWQLFASADGGNAAKLGGETATEWQTKLDNIQTTSRATLSTAGWYRVAEYKGRDENAIRGVRSNSCEIVIKRGYGNSPNEGYKLLLKSTYNVQYFKPINSISSPTYQYVTKIRYTHDKTALKAYIEIYYGGNTENDIFAIISDGLDFSANSWKAIDFIPTTDTVDGVTITTTYDIPANASPVTDLELKQTDTSFTGWTELTEGFDLNNALGKYRTASTTIVASLVNRPESISYGELTIEWFPSTSTNQYGTQVLKQTYSTTPTIWVRTRQSSTWTGWKLIIDNTELGRRLAKYFPITGGEVSGDLKVYGTGAVARQISLYNSYRRVYQSMQASGEYVLYDGTNDKRIITSTADGTNTFNGKATGQGNPVAIQSTAPSDTTALWVDTANNKVKAYKDGAWTAMA